MDVFDFKIVSNKPSQKDTLRVDSHRKNIKASLSVLRFIDKDTRQIVFYVPSADVTGYGENDQKAMEMVKMALNDFLIYLSEMSAKNLKIELTKLGWKKDILRNKEFSNVHVDTDGNLKDLNAVDDKVERMTLLA